MRAITRRELLAASAGAVGLAALDRSRAAADATQAAREIGLVGVDLLQPQDWPVARDAGLVPSIGYPSKRRDFIATGFNDRTNHAMFPKEVETTIPLAARAGVPNLGDIIRTIRDHIQHIGHFHTGGVPGRHEIDDAQELNYRAIARAIADLGFGEYLAHEFKPTRDPLTSLREAVAICAV